MPWTNPQVSQSRATKKSRQLCAPKRWVPLVAGAAAMLLAPAAASAGPTAKIAQACPQAMQSSVSSAPSATLCAVNAVRADRGLKALRSDAKLARAAQGHAQAMVSQKVFAHQLPGGATLGQRVRSAGFGGNGRWGAGEVIAWGAGSRSTPAATVQAWLQSPPHKKIILNGRFRKGGVAVVNGVPSGTGAGLTYTMNVGWAR